MAANSEAAFVSALTDHDLSSIKDRFDKHGWNTFSNFGFSCWNVKGQNEDNFDNEVFPKLAKATDAAERR